MCSILDLGKTLTKKLGVICIIEYTWRRRIAV